MPLPDSCTTNSSYWRRLALASACLLGASIAAACASAGGVLPDTFPTVDVSHIRALKIRPGSPSACPGGEVRMQYAAVFDDGSERAFASRGQPAGNLDPKLLAFETPTATASIDGQLRASADPLASAIKGFPVRVSLVARPAITAEATITPTYDCMPRGIVAIDGSSTRVCAVASRSEQDGNNCELVPRLARNASEGSGQAPVLSIRLGVVRTPFFDSLLVAVIEAPGDSPYVLLAPAPIKADMISVTAPGRNGRNGGTGGPGARSDNCMAGDRGGDGGDGSAGGDGRSLALIVQDDEAVLQAAVSAQLPGGRGGEGGNGGAGGMGGVEYTRDPVTGAQSVKCRGSQGSPGAPGKHGSQGRDGNITLGGAPLASLFVESAIWKDSTRRAELVELVNYSARAAKRTSPR